jgi:hypothetical protein
MAQWMGVETRPGSDGSEVKRLIFCGNVALRCKATAGQSGVNVSPIVLVDPSLIFRTASNRLFGRSPSRVRLSNLMILDGVVIIESGDETQVQGLNATFLGGRYWECNIATREWVDISRCGSMCCVKIMV